jgi:hypothetical protein
VTDFLETKRSEIVARLNELKPAVEEHSRLQAAAAALANLDGAARPLAADEGSMVRRRRGRPRGTGRGASTVTAFAAATAVASPASPASTEAKPVRKGLGRPSGRKKVGRSPGKVGRPARRPKGSGGRPKGGGTRAAEALLLVQGQPGMTMVELAERMGVKRTYLYRVLPVLEQDGKVEQKGRGWHPKS